MMHRGLVAGLVWVCSVATGAVAQQGKPIRLRVDLTDITRRIVHVTEEIPVHSGMNSLWYPQWIPGQELAGGPIDNLVGISFAGGSGAGKTLAWRRDLSNAFEFHVQVPAGVAVMTARFDVLETPSRFNPLAATSTTSHVTMLEPSDVVLYPVGMAVREIPVVASLHLPDGWKAATALRVEEGAAPVLHGQDTTFHAVSLEQFVDSPVLAGDHCRQYPVAAEVRPVHTMDVCAETDAGAEVPPEFLAHMSEMVRQETKAFQGHPYRHFDFLVALSPRMAESGLEHTQSTHYVISAAKLNDEVIRNSAAYLMPHEFTHAWCGKYRRPAGDATADFNTPMQNDLLWVYEGFTEYYGQVMSVRAGFRTPEEGVRALHFSEFRGNQPGRAWRNVQDTADASAILRDNDTAWGNWRLSQDYYWDGALMWLEADVKIRELSHGTKSLDDFAAAFFGSPRLGMKPHDAGPGVVPFTFADVVKGLNSVEAYDWAGFWTTRLREVGAKPVAEGLRAAGYDSTVSEEMSTEEARVIQPAHMAEMYYSLGFQVLPDSTLLDVWVGSPAYVAGLGPGDKLKLVNGKPYSADVLTEAVRAAKTDAHPITLTAVRDDEARAYAIPYHGGLKFSVLQRNERPDVLTTAIFLAR